MGRLGFGFGSARVASRATTPAPAAALPLLAPSAAWTGVAGSGFAAAPGDPVRTTAKPVLRLLTPPRQQFTDELVIGVYAAANDGGSLADTMGVAKVVFHYGGSSVEVLAPRFCTLTDANGAARAYFGWWAKLGHDGRNGVADLYAEAVPRDGAMQSRVIGPYQFLPSASLYDFQVEVAATPVQIAGQRYQTLKAAWDYLKSVNAQRPLVTISEAGTYVAAAPTGGWAPTALAGRCSVTASVPVTIVNATSSVQNATTEAWRIVLNAIRWKGANLTFDFRNAVQYYSETGQVADPWFDGVTMTDTSESLWRGRQKAGIQAQLHRAPTWFTECTVTRLSQVATQARLVRGCTLSGGYEDLFDDADCVIGNTVHDWDSRPWIEDRPVMSVTYAGGASTATMEASAYRTYTLKENGVAVTSLTVADTYANWDSGANRVQAVVDWINARGQGWSATLIDNTRSANLLAPPGAKGMPFGPTNAKGGLTLCWAADIHADLYQQKNGPALENRVFADNLGWRLQMQNIFIGGASPGGLRDALFANNALANFDDTADANNLSSQMGQAMSHVMIVHNSLSTQNLNTREDGGFNPDSRCLIANNVFRQFSRLGTADPDLVIRDNHLIAGGAPAFATGTTTGGTKASLFADEANGDLAPRGAMLANLKPPVVLLDRTGRARSPAAPVGANA